jgi:hypothetical protein
MFKKLAIAAVCLSFVSSDAYNAPFGIGIEKTNIKDIQKNDINQSSTRKPENIPGYTETFLKTERFSLNDSHPDFAKVFLNSEGIVEALAIEYKTDNASDFITDLDKKYYKTFSGKAFYGSYNDEYRSGNCLIRIVKPFGGKTLFIYGTIKWFNAYDEHYKQGAEIRQKRREFAKESSVQICNNDDTIIQHEKVFGERFNGLRKHFFNNFWTFDDFDEFFENTEGTKKLDKDTKIKSYRTEKRYSKVGDVEEWLYDDNGDITKIKKTPEGTTVTHGDEVKKTTGINGKTNEQLLYGRQIKDAGL